MIKWTSLLHPRTMVWTQLLQEESTPQLKYSLTKLSLIIRVVQVKCTCIAVSTCTCRHSYLVSLQDQTQKYCFLSLLQHSNCNTTAMEEAQICSPCVCNHMFQEEPSGCGNTVKTLKLILQKWLITQSCAKNKIKIYTLKLWA